MNAPYWVIKDPADGKYLWAGCERPNQVDVWVGRGDARRWDRKNDALAFLVALRRWASSAASRLRIFRVVAKRKAYGPPASTYAGLMLWHPNAELLSRIETIEAQVASLQLAMPKGLKHAEKP